MRNPLVKLLTFAALLYLPLLPFSGCVSDGGTEIPNEVKGTLYTVSGAPAVSAQVTLYPVNYEPGAGSLSDSGQYSVLTNASGRYSLKTVPSGTYNLVAVGQNVAAFRDSIFVTTSGASLPPDTLRTPGTITATVQLQPQHSPQTATVQVLGTDYYTNVPANGQFTLTLPQGHHRLRVSVSLEEYTPLFKTVTVTSGVNDTLAEPLAPFYSGIPVVRELTAKADSAGKIHLKWRHTDFIALRYYFVYRALAGSLSEGELIGVTNDTVFTDTVFAQSFGQFYDEETQSPYSDTTAMAYNYRVRVFSETEEIGMSYGFASASVRSAAYYQGIPRAVNLTAIPDSAGKVTLRWNPSHPGASGVFHVYRASAGSSSPGTYLKSLTDTTFVDTVFAQSYGQNATGTRLAFTDTVSRNYEYRVQLDGIPSAESSPLSSPASATAYPPARSPAYNSGRWHRVTANGPFATHGSSHYPAMVTYKNALYLFWPASSSNNASVWRSNDGSSWQNILSALPFSTDVPVRVTVLRDTLWVMGGTNSGASGNSIWKSADGITWIAAKSSAALPGQSASGSTVNTIFSNGFLNFNNQLWVVGGMALRSLDALRTVQARSFYGGDGINWTEASYLPATLYGSAFQTGLASISGKASYNGKIWIIGGGAERYYNQTASATDSVNRSIWSSGNGLTWSKETAPTPFLPREGHAFENHLGTLWMIGGQGFNNVATGSRTPVHSEVWNTTDGSTWNLVDLFAPFPPRRGAATGSIQGKLWVIGGARFSTSTGSSSYPPTVLETYNDVWYYE
jgi:hypothetical protein